MLIFTKKKIDIHNMMIFNNMEFMKKWGDSQQGSTANYFLFLKKILAFHYYVKDNSN